MTCLSNNVNLIYITLSCDFYIVHKLVNTAKKTTYHISCNIHLSLSLWSPSLVTCEWVVLFLVGRSCSWRAGSMSVFSSPSSNYLFFICIHFFIFYSVVVSVHSVFLSQRGFCSEVLHTHWNKKRTMFINSSSPPPPLWFNPLGSQFISSVAAVWCRNFSELSTLFFWKHI